MYMYVMKVEACTLSITTAVYWDTQLSYKGTFLLYRAYAKHWVRSINRQVTDCFSRPNIESFVP